MANIVQSKDLKVDKTFDHPFEMLAVGNPGVLMAHAIIPPRGRTKRQFHVNCNVGIYCLKGRQRLFFGPSYEQEEAIAEQGDFVFIRHGDIHASLNDSETEPAEVILFYVGVSSKDDVKTVCLE